MIMANHMHSSQILLQHKYYSVVSAYNTVPLCPALGYDLKVADSLCNYVKWRLLSVDTLTVSYSIIIHWIKKNKELRSTYFVIQTDRNFFDWRVELDIDHWFPVGRVSTIRNGWIKVNMAGVCGRCKESLAFEESQGANIVGF